MVLQIGERTYAPCGFYKKSPGSGWKVHIWDPAPAKGQRCTEYCEDDKCQVKQQNGVRCKMKIHACLCATWSSRETSCQTVTAPSSWRTTSTGARAVIAA